MTDEPLSPEDQELALASIALVRVAIQNKPPKETSEVVNLMLTDRTPEEISLLVFRIADLAATILESWHAAVLSMVPVDMQGELATPEELLDDLVKLLVKDEL